MIQYCYTKYNDQYVKAIYSGSDEEIFFTFEINHEDLLDNEGNVVSHSLDPFVMAELERVHGEDAIGLVVDSLLAKWM